MRNIWWVAVALLLGVVVMKRQREGKPPEVDPGRAIVPGAVIQPRPGGAPQPGAFRLVEVGAAPEGGTRYVAEATGGAAGSPPCTFELTLGKVKAASDVFAFAGASVARRPKADCTAFLKAFAPELGFKGALPSPPRVASLSAQAAILGRDHSRDDEGGFSSQPPGPWLASKLFLADGEGEVFLNLNARDRVGELSLKDEEYATVVVTELAKVLLPEAP